MQNVTGYMVGTEYEQRGMVKHGSHQINAVTNSTVPHLTVQVGGSYGAGNYGMAGRPYNPRFLFVWPNAKTAVMGAEQLAGTLSIVARKSAEDRGLPFDEEADAARTKQIEDQITHEEQATVMSGQLYDDGLIDPPRHPRRAGDRAVGGDDQRVPRPARLRRVPDVRREYQ